MNDAKNNRPLVAGGGAETFDAGDVSRSRFDSITFQGQRQDLRLPSGKIGDVSTGAVWRADLETVRRDGIVDDLGAGRQIFLPLGRWKLVYQPERPATMEPEPEPVQLELFELR